MGDREERAVQLSIVIANGESDLAIAMLAVRAAAKVRTDEMDADPHRVAVGTGKAKHQRVWVQTIDSDVLFLLLRQMQLIETRRLYCFKRAAGSNVIIGCLVEKIVGIQANEWELTRVQTAHVLYLMSLASGNDCVKGAVAGDRFRKLSKYVSTLLICFRILTLQFV